MGRTFLKGIESHLLIYHTTSWTLRHYQGPCPPHSGGRSWRMASRWGGAAADGSRAGCCRRASAVAAFKSPLVSPNARHKNAVEVAVAPGCSLYSPPLCTHSLQKSSTLICQECPWRWSELILSHLDSKCMGSCREPFPCLLKHCGCRRERTCIFKQVVSWTSGFFHETPIFIWKNDWPTRIIGIWVYSKGTQRSKMSLSRQGKQ